MTRRHRKGEEEKPLPIWVRCGLCDDFLCTIHGKHVHECICPSIEVWERWGVDPYTDVAKKKPKEDA